MNLKMYQVDAFTDTLFGGNSAAVLLLERWLPDALLMQIAMENNLSETAYLVRNGDAFDLRWFTPAHEVAFCGHATLASAHVLMAEYGIDGPLTFHTRKVGTLTVSAGDNGSYILDVPRLDPEPAEVDLEAALGIKPVAVLRNFENLFAVLGSAQEVHEFVPDASRILALNEQGLCITAAGGPGDNADFVSRYFAPEAGIDEDPVTGSTHATLVPYWAGELNKTQMKAYQCSARGGRLHCTLTDERVLLGGQAVTFMEASIRLPG